MCRDPGQMAGLIQSVCADTSHPEPPHAGTRYHCVEQKALAVLGDCWNRLDEIFREKFWTCLIHCGELGASHGCSKD